jgi:MFS family permease
LLGNVADVAPRQARSAALLTVALGQFVVMMAMVPVAAMLPTLADVFHTEFSVISWAVGAYLLALSGFILVAGRFGDLYGYRRVYILGIVVYSVVGGLCGFMTDVLPLIALRFVQGIGGALMFGNALAILASYFPGDERGRAVGVAQVASSAGAVFGLAFTGLLSDSLGWQWLFWLLWPLGALALWFARRLPPENNERRALARPDLLGAVLLFLTLTVASLSLSHLHGGGETFEAGWAYHTSFQVVALVLLGVFVYVERRQAHPLLQFRDLRNWDFNALALCNGIMHMVMMTSSFTTPFLIERALELPKTYTGGYLAATQITWVVFAGASGVVYDRYRATWLAPVGMALVCIGLAGMGLLAPFGFGAIVLMGLVNGMGMGLYMTVNNTMAISIMPANLRGLASGVLETARQTGHSLAVAIAGAMMGAAVAESLSGGNAAGFLAGFQHVVWTMSVVCAVAVALSIRPARSAPRPAPRRAQPAPMAGGQE